MKPMNIRVAGLGGMGVLKCAEILSTALFRAGYDVKKAEVHGMSQRGGSVASDVRFGDQVLSPMIPEGEMDALIVLDPGEAAAHQPHLRAGGFILQAADFDAIPLPSRRSLGVAMLGALSRRLDVPAAIWTAVLHDVFSEPARADNIRAFELGQTRGPGETLP
ncbi:MAG: 2-oxoacid:acceptor oxidoreductase family protein [Kiritimatiellae bacterium]|nr:2-oxoacid:acceptor oxidoreductase family protein [Kiritimatiellia bacterium]